MIRQACLFFFALAALVGPNARARSADVVDANPPDRIRLAVQAGHTRPVRRVLWNPDGRSIASASDDGSIKVWETASGRIQATLPRYGGPARWVGNAVAWSPDGNLLAYASPDNSILVWDRRTDELRAPLTGHGDLVLSLAWSRDSSTLATGARDGTVRFWNARAGFSSAEPVEIGAAASSLAYSPTANAVVVGCSEGLVAVVAADRSVAARTKLAGDVTYLAWSPDGRGVGVKLEDSTLLVLDAGTLATRARLAGASNVDHRFAWSPRGDAIASAGTYARLRVWAADGTPRAGFAAPGPEVHALEWSPDGERLLAASDTAVSVLDGRTGRVVERRDTHGAASDAVAWSPDGSRVAAGGEDGVVRLWNAIGPDAPTDLRGEAVHGASAAWSPDGRRFAIGGDRLVVWNVESGRIEHALDGQKGGILSVAWSPDGASIATGGADKTARIWSTETWRQTALLPGHPAQVTAVAWSPNGEMLATACGNRWPTGQFSTSPVRLWNPRTGKLLSTLSGLSGDAMSLAWRSDNETIAIGVDLGVEIWSTSTRKKLGHLEGPDLFATSLAWTPDGQRLAAGSWRTVSVWNVDDLSTPVTTEDPFDDQVTSVAWVGDGSALVAGTGDGRIAMLGADGSSTLANIADESACVGLAVSPDARTLVSVDESGTSSVWSIADPAAPKRLCSIGALEGDGWIVVDPDGRFDASDLDEIRGIHWVLAADACRTLPIEIFMRQYYEPRLLARLLAGDELPEIPSIATLNRARPSVRIIEAKADPGNATATVRVAVAPGEASTPRAGARERETSAAYDLRLFRDGQLVGSSPQGGGAVAVDPTTGAATLTFAGVKLPSGRRSSVEFSAYAFNVDRVKSETDRRTLELPSRPARPRRAYVVTVGVNAGDDPDLDLRFAANDARSLADAVGGRLAAGKAYDEIVTVRLTSERGGPALATKANIRAALDRLAGRSVDPSSLAGVDGADRLASATPDDLVVLAFSGHGFADRSGDFYVVPSDTGPNVRARARAALDGATDVGLDRFVSSAEMASWLRDVDAGEMVLVVDACQSAASVASDGFKPGPMGSRGLGQLAYDKRLRILAATQTDDVALESGALQHGLLTYALVRDGLDAWQADSAPRDGVVQFGEWLAYGVARVPDLAREIAAKRVQPFGLEAPRLLVHDESGAGAPSVVHRVQQPALFDFARGRATTLAQRNRAR